MSHTATIKGVEITDVKALEAAVRDLNKAGVPCELIANATPRAYYHGQEGLGKADFVLKLHNSKYDVGLYKSGKNYEARTDFWQKHVENQLGVQDDKVDPNQAKLGKLYQLYAVNATERSLTMKGISSRRIVKDNGTVQLIAQVA